MKLLFLFFLLTGTAAKAQYSDTTLSVYFPVNGSNPDTLQMNMLERPLNVAREIKQVVGFADSTGSVTYNLQLSRKRAHAIADFLNKRYGFPRPILLSMKVRNLKWVRSYGKAEELI